MNQQGDRQGATESPPSSARPVSEPNEEQTGEEESLPDISADGPVALVFDSTSAERTEKVAMVAALNRALQLSNAYFLADYRGLTAKQFALLRSELRTEATVAVVKNSLFERAAAQVGAPLTIAAGPTAVTFVHGEAQKVASALSEFARKNPTFSVKAGVVEGALLGESDIELLATLPSRQVLLASIAGRIRDALSRPATDINTALHATAILVTKLRDTKDV